MVGSFRTWKVSLATKRALVCVHTLNYLLTYLHTLNSLSTDASSRSSQLMDHSATGFFTARIHFVPLDLSTCTLKHSRVHA